ncbi:3'(2'),5'-bisphosphate nucleotidase CysQ [Cohaesibacter sp. CAU 1516]|uniref:3'(2'),5'-bisphosphate nucleotidase CysQ n=1 Tax=Cohaesibacter sp. CAU 1516 TaxID=2576038 RepID=UPI001FEF518B|nr:3'(2'),5'-bisphosphate nucleotidase CysQ [Cohaesibacter sp. CAU 1516]
MTIKPTSEDRDDLALLETAAREAGAIALGYFKADPQVWTKGNSSPVTEADLAVDKYLHKTLMARRPDYGWLSEESEDDKSRLQKDRIFVIDPIDGTRAFIDAGTEWTISLAVVERGRPVAAALFAPVRDEMYCAHLNGGATLNGETLVCPDRKKLQGARAAGPGSAIRKGPLARAGVECHDYIRSLAYRIVMITTGALDLALAREHANDWDLAAADLIVEEAKGQLRDKNGSHLLYNQPQTRHASLYAANAHLGELVQPMMARLSFPVRR